MPGLGLCIAHAPEFREVHRARSKRRAWSRWGKKGPKPTADAARPIEDLDARDYDTSRLRKYLLREQS